MNEQEKENLYKLFRDHEEIMGSSRTTLVALQSFKDSLKRLKCKEDEFKNLVLELNDVIKNTEPKIIPLIHLIESFEEEMQPHFGKPVGEAKALSLKILDKKITLFESHMKKVIEYGMEKIQDGDFIIAHSPSAVVKAALVRAHTDQKKQFKVLVLEQDFIRIKQLIIALSQAGVEHLVIPEYNLSHFLDSVNKMFLGAISVTPDRKVIATVGSANIVSLCHLNEIPIYLFINSLKFAHQIVSRQHIYREEGMRIKDHLAYPLTTFSHDMVDFALIDHVITEEGEMKKDLG